ncbi:MAG: NAD(P)/FAD-dependent oxidoreductase [Deltaproteobacteria bacterium]|nr:NAD(P)/FAD-dependent oxidoreductase [Deltaproteobacteria bacterium]
MTAVEHHEVIIVGAGFAGIGLAYALRRAGFEDLVVFERAGSIGGTWRDNTYPGVACDVPSNLYSFSFAPNPDWSRFFSPQPEIRDYLERCTDALGVRPFVRLNTSVTAAAFDEEAGLWRVRTSAGAHTARVLVSCAGHALSQPVYPDIPGREDFAGVAMHSARWDDGVDLRGKSVAVVGTGASAIQIVPAIVERTGRLYVFQRTPGWVVSRPDFETTPLQRRIFRRWPLAQKLVRGVTWALLESFAVGHVHAPELNKVHEWRGRRLLRRSVADPALRARLLPGYRFGCKRLLMSNTWYPALQEPHVELVIERIAAIEPDAIVTADGVRREVDVIVYATGYVAAEARPPFPITGLGGRALAEVWSESAEAYLGTAIAGFPNLFMVVGPNVGLGHSSMVLMMESQFAYIVDAVRTLRSRRLRWVDVRPEQQRRYNAWLQRRLARTVWNTGGCRSWYLTPGGKNTTVWPGFTFEFRARTRRFDVENYECAPDAAP